MCSDIKIETLTVCPKDNHRVNNLSLSLQSCEDLYMQYRPFLCCFEYMLKSWTKLTGAFSHKDKLSDAVYNCFKVQDIQDCPLTCLL